MKYPLCLLLLTCAAGYAQEHPSAPAPDAGMPPAALPGEGAGRGAAPSSPAVTTGGRGRGAAAPAASAASAPAPKDLKYPPRRGVQIPAVTPFTLPNGMKVFLQEDHELPMVTGVALVRTGTLFDPPERIGLAQLVGTVLRTGGTALKSGEQVDDLLEGMAARIESEIGESVGTVSFFSLKENTDSVLTILKEILTRPGFRQDKLDQARVQLRDVISHRNDDLEALTHREFRDLVYGKDNPFGWEQRPDTIDRITRADVRNFYQRYFFPANIIFGLRGDFDTAQMKASLEKLFADWTVQQQPVPEFPKVNNAPSPGIYLVERKDTTQSFFTIGHLGGRLNDKDYAAMEVMSNVLGGGSRSRLAERTRAKLGNSAEIHVNWAGTPDHPGLFEIAGSTRVSSTTATVKAVQEEVERLRTAEVTEEELRVARDAALNRSIFAFDSKAKIFSSLLDYEYYGYPKDFMEVYQTALQSVTRADILRAAKQYINPANLTVVVSGNPVLFGDSLARLGPVTRVDTELPQVKAELAETNDTSLAQGKQLLAKAQAAAGGADRLASVRDYSMVAEYQIDASVPSLGGIKITQTDRWVSPTVFRQDSNLPSGRVAAYTDGKSGWISTPQGWGALAGTQRNQVFGDLFRVYFRLLLSDRIEGRTVNAVDDVTLQISDATGQVTSVEFDPKTALPRKISYDTAQAAGPTIYSEDLYEDFREIGGIRIPFKITITQGGRKFSDVIVTDYRINSGIKPPDLAKRPQ